MRIDEIGVSENTAVGSDLYREEKGMLNVVIWGNREQYDLFINQIKFEELKGNICIKGVVTENVNKLGSFDGYKICNKNELKDMDLDIVLVTNVNFYFESIKAEIQSINSNVKVVNARILNIPQFDFKRYYSILIKGVSIISNNCWGGLTYHSLYMEFLSPFINLTVPSSDYIKMLWNFREYMHKPLEMVKDRDGNGNPIGRLGDVEINFVHYKNFQYAKQCWEKRVQRINYDNLFVYMAIEDDNNAKDFSNLPIEIKRGFCGFECDYSNVYYVQDFVESGEVRSIFAERGFNSYMNDQARRKLYDYDDTLGNRGAKTVKTYDVLRLLNGEEKFFRGGGE